MNDMQDSFKFGDFSFSFGDAGGQMKKRNTARGFGGAAPCRDEGEDGDDMGDKTDAKRAHRRTVACQTLSKQYLYRRAFSEVSLLEAMRYERLEMGRSYHFITGGDVDQLSYLKVVLDQYRLDYLLCSTWVMAAEDLLQMQEWWREGRIRRFDTYIGEIFPNSYKIEWGMMRDFYREHPEAGRVAVFRNHSKVFAGCAEKEGFYFGVQSSANINHNPRTEQGCIVCDRGIYDFYKGYFDGIVSFIKD